MKTVRIGLVGLCLLACSAAAAPAAESEAPPSQEVFLQTLAVEQQYVPQQLPDATPEVQFLAGNACFQQCFQNNQACRAGCGDDQGCLTDCGNDYSVCIQCCQGTC